jgi:TorA maturation chaperone TorD
VSTLDLVAQAERRARIAAMLGRLLLQEPGPDAADLVAGLPELEPLGRTDPDLAVTYERLFLREIPLFESVFLDADGQRGGPVVADVLDTYRHHDFDEASTWRVPSPDHLGIELRFLGYLAAREATAWQDERPDEATKQVEAQREFLALHLGQWGEVATTAVLRRAGDSPYRGLATAVTELLAAESERLRPAPDHPGMAPVASDQPPRRLGPAHIARWLLTPSRAGAFLDVDDLADAATAIGAPWRPSDPRRAFRHVVESALDGGDLGRLLTRLRPAIETWRDSHATNESDREGSRRIWRRWRLQAEHTLALIHRVADPGFGTPTTDATSSVVVLVSGPAHGDRADTGAAIVAALAGLGRIAVSTGLRPHLTSNLAALLDAGADEILLDGSTVTAVALTDRGDIEDRERRHLPDTKIIIRLVPSATPPAVTVEGHGPLADAIRQRLASTLE